MKKVAFVFLLCLALASASTTSTTSVSQSLPEYIEDAWYCYTTFSNLLGDSL